MMRGCRQAAVAGPRGRAEMTRLTARMSRSRRDDGDRSKVGHLAEKAWRRLVEMIAALQKEYFEGREAGEVDRRRAPPCDRQSVLW